jgi:hypothetical protein
VSQATGPENGRGEGSCAVEEFAVLPAGHQVGPQDTWTKAIVGTTCLGRKHLYSQTCYFPPWVYELLTRFGRQLASARLGTQKN